MTVPIRAVWIALLLVAFPILLPAQEQPIPASSPEDGVNSITAEEVLGHIKFLASDDLKGRFSGSEDERKVIDYISAEFKRYGLSPGGKGGSWFQEFPVENNRRVSEKTAVTLSDSAGEIPLRITQYYLPIGVTGEGSCR